MCHYKLYRATLAQKRHNDKVISELKSGLKRALVWMFLIPCWKTILNIIVLKMDLKRLSELEESIFKCLVTFQFTCERRLKAVSQKKKHN